MPIDKSKKRNAREQLSLISMIAGRLSETGLDTVSLAAILALAAKGLLPGHLKNRFAGSLLSTFAKRSFGLNQLRVDSTNFADCLTALFDDAFDKSLELEWIGDFEKSLIKSLEDLLADSAVRESIEDPLFVGWVYQTVLMSRQNYSELRNQKSISALAQISQWFTPGWISEFLIDECFGNCDRTDVTFLDSSCGAGHILAPALRRLARNNSLNEVLTKQLYGIDIDPMMVRLSALTLYLIAREIEPEAPLPIPQLFSFSEQDCQGSLLLSLQPRPEDVFLIRVDESRIALADLPGQFDLQGLNPPYLSHRLLPKSSGIFLRQHYNGSHYDLYTAFLELSIRLMAPEGKLALICQQSFLTTTRFQDLRKQLIERCRINSIVQLGAGSFASRGGEKVNNAIVSLTRNGHEQANSETREISAFKLISRLAKTIAEVDGIENFEKIQINEQRFLAKTSMIPGSPLAPFCPDEIAQLFSKYESIEDGDNGITLTNGLFTCDNKRFVRHFTQFPDSKNDNYVPYDKGGGQKWFSTTPYLLEWKNNGDDIREFRAQRGQSRSLPGERFYFQQGITYSYIGTKGFKARLLSPDSIFDIASSSMFTAKIDLYYLLGFLNSALARYVLGMLNPTINFQIGDLRRLPFHAPPQGVETMIASLAQEAVDLAREAEQLNPASPAFSTTRKPLDIGAMNRREREIQDAIDNAVFDLYELSNAVRETIRRNEWVISTDVNLIGRA